MDGIPQRLPYTEVLTEVRNEICRDYFDQTKYYIHGSLPICNMITSPASACNYLESIVPH